MNEQGNINLVENGTMWFPSAASELAADIDKLYYFIYGASLFLFIGIILVTLFFLFKYRRTKDNPIAKKQVSHNSFIEVVWTVIPFLLVLVIFYWGYKDYLRLTNAPLGTKQIRVEGKKWFWQFEYAEEGFKTVGELVVPVGENVELILSSVDVNHSFYIPNFRVKRDVFPNRYTSLWFPAEKVGNYQIFCTEYCGDAHSTMYASLRVVTQEEYDEWVAKAQSDGDDLPLDKLGEKVYSAKGCNACHSLDGSDMVGPTWKGLYGANRDFQDGTSSVADDNYIRESIIYPNKKIVSGYQGVMPSYAGLLSDREINGVIEFIKTLK